MKRIREFKIIVGSATGEVEHLFTGWHMVWDFVLASLEEPTSVAHIYDAQAKHSAIIARFSADDWDNETNVDTAKTPATHWRSEAILTPTGQTRYAIRNVTDFGWYWVEGAKHELPFRLSYFERGAERNPSGVIARLMELGAEARDLLRLR